MSVISFSAKIEGKVTESKILFLIQNFLLYTLIGNLSAVFPSFYTSIFSVCHILSVRMISFGTRICYPSARADVT